MPNKGIFVAENMASIKVGSYLRSAKQATEIENGAVVKLGALVTGEIDTYNALPVAALTDKVVLVDGVEVIYDEHKTFGLDDFVNEKEKAFRVRIPVVNDRFSISESMISGTATVGQIVETPATGNKLIARATATADASLVCRVVAKWTFGTRAIPMVRLEVIKA